MTEAAEKLLAEAMKLSPEERELLVERLSQSTAAANDDLDADDAAEQDGLDDAKRGELHASLERTAADSEAGRGMDVSEFLRQRRESLHTG